MARFPLSSAERLRISGALATLALARMRGLVLSSWQRLALVLQRPPRRLLVAPQDIRTIDPVRVEEYQRGQFTFGGQSLDVGAASPFAQEPPSTAFARALCDFGWLRHVRAAPGAEISTTARKLVDDFLRYRKPCHSPALEPDVTARRLLSFLSQSPILLEGADRDFYDRFLHGLKQDHDRVQRALCQPQADITRLNLILAAAAYSLCAAVSPQRLQRAGQRLAKELAAQVLADGCHISRNPGVLVAVALDLMPLQQAFVARGITPPRQLAAALTRLQAHLRKLRHPDGSLALFNGMGPSAMDALALALAHDGNHELAPSAATPGGYLRLGAGNSVLIMDGGLPPPMRHSASAHAGTLAFEFSSGDQRLVINCGSCDDTKPLLREAGRLTAAHSTLEIDETSSATFAADHGLQAHVRHQIISGPEEVDVEHREEAGDQFLGATHDGYARHFGLLHTRQLGLSRRGDRLIGEDSLHPAPGGRSPPALPFSIRFHLHPSVRAVPADNGRAIRLETSHGEAWLFEAGGTPLALEDSALIASRAGTRPTTQIVISGETGATTRFAWSLTRASSGS
ncbi:MAG: heparinase II/III family protein [Hyphomicrobiales bacterium]|nr:heparinase II/III family protein [Hyphomicrobiales bacterium]